VQQWYRHLNNGWIIGRNVDASTFADMIVDQFDEMLEQSASGPLVMGIALHAYEGANGAFPQSRNAWPLVHSALGDAIKGSTGRMVRGSTRHRAERLR